ncbi:hypothetical protein CAOG_08662 [Capsaspora owczarzaki ATCC 30864]|uniref:Dehydrogenase/reductase SDR family member 12 n=1 Tax=Capsaspora owczarzaki (strain ATCC 30864) TaxID=595528 RepID=A0A0D2WMF8_CAPO3|nr:hypothetical protein CAOG_08662 [Capsaspora owczarzaki ATCC 30864]KJE92005.1 hypothetical protein CAOG_008662 [Capsaspora owczarzaki ATCC 30864]|eukprot:XP_011270273.1 hypothetical protein CAOG_08662 [Capsaspora owczarzaki ATCC 30864]
MSTTAYRTAAWLWGGARRYTNAGYERAAASFNAGDLDVTVRVEGRSFMVTGANSGIGYATCREIVLRGGVLHMVCRNPERAEAAQRKLLEETKVSPAMVEVHILDISCIKDVARFAQEFCASGKPLHVLINNAGCMVRERQTTSEGLEVNFATNTLGPYVLTTALIPVLAKAPNARVLNVSSGGMLLVKLDMTDPQLERPTKFDGQMAYAHNKRQMMVIMDHWAKVHASDGISFYSMHPGWADTPAVRESMPDFHKFWKNKLRTEEQGADTLVFLAISGSVTPEQSGEFFEDRAVTSKHLSLCRTQSTPAEEEQLVQYVSELASKLTA